MATSTIGTVLKFGLTSGALTKVCPITSYPDMIGDPELLETTTLDDGQATNIPGVKGSDILQFEALFDATVWASLATNEGSLGFFALEFGASGADGKFTWKGSYTLGLPGHGVNEVRTMTINVVASTVVTKAA